MIAELRQRMPLTRAWLALVMLLCLAVLAWDGVRSYLDQRNQTVERLSALAKVMEARTEVTFRALSLMLMEAAEQLPESAAPGDQAYQRFLKSRSFILTEALTLSVVSPQGVIVHSSRPDLVGRAVGERGYLNHFRAHPEDTRLLIAPPATSIVGTPIIFVARAVRDAKGALRAVVVSGISPEQLSALIEPAMPSEPSGAVALLNHDGIVLARYPGLAEAAPGTSLAASPAFLAHRQTGHVQSVQDSPGGPDSFRRLLVLRNNDTFGLLLVTTISNADLWRPATQSLLADLVFLVIVGTIVIVLSRFLGGQERQRTQAQQEVAAARDYYMRLLDHLPIHIWRTDALGRVDYTNATLQTFIGDPLGDLTPQIHPGDLALWQEAVAARQSQQHSSELEYRLRRQDGEYRWIHELAQPFHRPDGTFAGHLAAGLDVTETRETQEKLTQSNAELEQFAYVASHDMREPLRMINSYMGLIERRLGDQVSAEIKEFIGFARDGANRMDKLIIDLLQFSRIGRMSAPRRSVDLGDTLATAMANLGIMIDEHQARICVSALPTINASEDDMVRLFQNLIANAIKYAQDNVAPVISITAERDAGDWRFSVADNGIGIDPTYFDRIFRIFQRLHGRDEHGGGSGIGLSICKKIVENHGGRIWVESPGANQGCTFFFTLPALNA